MQKLSNHDVPAREKLSYLHDFVGSSVAGLRFTPHADDDFEFELALRGLDGDALVGEARYSPLRIERTRELTADGRNNYMLTIHDTDYELEIEGGRTFHVAKGDIVIVNESVRHSLALPGVQVTAIVLDERQMAGLSPAIRSEPLHRVPATVPGAVLLAGYARMLLDTPADEAAARLAGGHLHELTALALEQRLDRPARETAGIGGARLAMIKEDIARNLTDPELDIDTIARRQGVSPRYVQRLFEREGTTFSEYLRAARLDFARDTLAAGDPRTISAIAFDAGFGDLSHFNKAFRRRFGATPSDIRTAALRRRQ